MSDKKPLQKIKNELLQGLESKRNGNQGRARVCARRAAGWAIQEHLHLNGKPVPSTVALELIRHFSELERHSDQVDEVLHHLLIRVEKDSFEQDAYYPIEGVDLVAEAHWLAQELLDVEISLD